MLFAIDRDNDFVQMPHVTAAWRFASQAARIDWTELDHPASNGLIGNDDPSLEQHLFDQTQTGGNRKYSHTAWAMICEG